MPSFILKVTPDRDFYVEWSTVVDNLTRTATRAEFLKYLAARDPGLLHDPDHCPQARLARVDATGTSALFPTPSSPFGGWEDDGLMVEQRGILCRADLLAYVAAMEADDPDTAYALLVPFDEEEDHGEARSEEGQRREQGIRPQGRQVQAQPQEGPPQGGSPPRQAGEAVAMMDESIWERLPAERCACGLVSRGLVTGECADCRARAAAGMKRAAARPAVDQLTLETVARTLRTVATQFMDDRGLMDLAEDVEHLDVGSLRPPDGHLWCCPVCQETTCDDGCPLAEIRTA